MRINYWPTGTVLVRHDHPIFLMTKNKVLDENLNGSADPPDTHSNTPTGAMAPKAKNPRRLRGLPSRLNP